MKARIEVWNDVGMAWNKRSLAIEKVKNKFFISWREEKTRRKVETCIFHLLYCWIWEWNLAPQFSFDLSLYIMKKVRDRERETLLLSLLFKNWVSCCKKGGATCNSIIIRKWDLLRRRMPAKEANKTSQLRLQPKLTLND